MFIFWNTPDNNRPERGKVMYYKQPFASDNNILYAKVFGTFKNGNFDAIVYDPERRKTFQKSIRNIALWIKCEENDLPEKFKKVLKIN